MNGEFPKTWQQTTIIQIPKPGKDHAKPPKYKTDIANQLPLQNDKTND